ncbi:MAG: BamA/TamA family outer membrane protein [Mediterranea sp.]|nr:BamA/TamA family outer membrane protein [Mediterranea sp.]
MSKGFPRLLLLYILVLFASCSSTKYVANGSYLLDEVKIHTDNKDVKPSTLQPYVRQNPNAKWFNAIKIQLYIYNLSGRDSTRWVNRFLRKIGNEPVIYNEALAQRSENEITKAVQNMGYMGATVKTGTKIKKKKLKLSYDVALGKPYTIRSIKREINDSKITACLPEDSLYSLLKEGMLFNVNVLDAERQRVTNRLLRNGYYKFNKDFITYIADTVKNTHWVDLTLQVLPYKAHISDTPKDHNQYTLNNVSFIIDYDIMRSSSLNSIYTNDSIHYNGIPIYYSNKPYLRPKILVNNLRLQQGDLYDERDVQRTYSNFGRLSALKYTNIRFIETQIGDSAKLDAYILLTKSKSQSVSFEIEGTNSAGDLGAAAAVSYHHRNLFHGSERLLLKFRGAYEAISGLTQDYKNDNYTEYGVEASINFPRFLFPFLSSDFRRGIRATTEFRMQYNYQIRPEFLRMVASASWSYHWIERQRAQHRIDLIDVNYLYMPSISDAFQELYEGNKNYILEYNYKDRLIVRMGYTYNYNSVGANLTNNTIASNSYSIRAGIESAGNALYAFSKLAGLPRNGKGEYSLLNIPFAQYIKADFDFAKNIVMDERNSLAYHLGMGIAIPYGNAGVIPFEKRYFSGGANSVRGWSVRNLGPGSFSGDENFLNQSGDIKLDASVELRSELFWKFQGALFVDAGNIWTLHNYSEEQPGGKFKFDRFYRQIAVAYGLGLRLDLDFFVIRLDGGMKAIDPVYSSGKQRYPIIRPKFGRDFALHFAVGYPF